MPLIRYIGPFDRIEVAGHEVAQGEEFDVDTATAKSLLAQADNFTAATKAKGKE